MFAQYEVLVVMLVVMDNMSVIRSLLDLIALKLLTDVFDVRSVVKLVLTEVYLILIMSELYLTPLLSNY